MNNYVHENIYINLKHDAQIFYLYFSGVYANVPYFAEWIKEKLEPWI